MKSDLRYNPSDVFDTYPFLDETTELTDLGRQLHAIRAAAMSERGLGLTKFYNLVNDHSIVVGADEVMDTVRALHKRIDEVVLRARGWTDISLDYDFYPFSAKQRWTMSPTARDEVLDRLLEENHRRAAAEAAALPKKAAKGRKAKSMSEGMETLFS